MRMAAVETLSDSELGTQRFGCSSANSWHVQILTFNLSSFGLRCGGPADESAMPVDEPGS